VFLTPVSDHNCPHGADKNYGVFKSVIISQAFFGAGEKDNVIPSRPSQTSSVRVRVVGFQ
jgi:hypothetical protein